jgi:L-ascorbate metabolism protein UlaG (beta-lactamase superfamily)
MTHHAEATVACPWQIGPDATPCLKEQLRPGERTRPTDELGLGGQTYRSSAVSKSLVVFSALGLIAICSSMSADAAGAPVTTLSGDHIKTNSGGDLIIHPIKHATLAMSWNGLTVYVDPAVVPGAPGNPDPTALFAGMPPPDLILVTHMHPDHFDGPALDKLAGTKTTVIAPQSVVEQMPVDLKSRAHILANGKSMDVGKIRVEAVPAYNVTQDRLQFHPKGRDNGYILTFGGKRVYIAGDTEGVPEMLALQNIDVAFIPMNVPYTMTPERAAEAVNAFKPSIVYPYHYGQSDISAFAKAVGPGIEVRQRAWY